LIFGRMLLALLLMPLAAPTAAALKWRAGDEPPSAAPAAARTTLAPDVLVLPPPGQHVPDCATAQYMCEAVAEFRRHCDYECSAFDEIRRAAAVCPVRVPCAASPSYCTELGTGGVVAVRQSAWLGDLSLCLAGLVLHGDTSAALQFVPADRPDQWRDLTSTDIYTDGSRGGSDDAHHLERVLNHLSEKSERCRAVFLATIAELPDVQVRALDAEEAARLRDQRRAGYGAAFSPNYLPPRPCFPCWRPRQVSAYPTAACCALTTGHGTTPLMTARPSRRGPL
jgi:hypothetical protein